MTKKILLIATGGTIASRQGADGLAPSISADEILDIWGPRFPCLSFSAEDIMSLDSVNVQPEHWRQIALRAHSALDTHDGVIITHGTDTMPYTASALSFMLRNLRKSVVITGSQLPIDAPGTDAFSNLHLAASAVSSGITGVTLAFDRLVINGARAVKTSTMDFAAFESVNAPPMAIMRADGLRVIRRAAAPIEPDAPAAVEPDMCPDVFLLKLVPGMSPGIFGALRGMGCRGIVLEAFGVGGINYAGRSLIPEVSAASGAGIPVVVCSQCLHERTDLSVYEAGAMLLRAGVIGGADMTTESAVVKLMWALGRTGDVKEIARIFASNYAGEIDPSLCSHRI